MQHSLSFKTKYKPIYLQGLITGQKWALIRKPKKPKQIYNIKVSRNTFNLSEILLLY